MTRAGWIAALGVAIGLGLTGLAEARPPRGGHDAGGRAGSSDRREQVKKRIRAMRAYALTEELGLDEVTSARLFPTLARYDDETDRLVQKRLELQRKLRRVDAIRDPRAIDRLIDDATANQRAFWELEDRRLAELRKLLTPAQTARLLVVLPALERRIQRALQRAIVRHGDDVDDDDDTQPDEAVAPVRPRRETSLPPRP